jgi:hypothetical protein
MKRMARVSEPESHFGHEAIDCCEGGQIASLGSTARRPLHFGGAPTSRGLLQARIHTNARWRRA